MTHVVADAGLLDVNGTLIAELIAFVLMVLLLAKFVYPRIIAVATEREKKIEAGMRAAEESERRLADVQQQVQKILDEARSQARDILARAHQDAVLEAQEVANRARAEADALIERARSEIGAERDRAIQELRAEVANLVVDAASKLIGQTLDRNAHQKLIDESLNKVSAGARSGRNN
jgi:F-type H+-transporting ATPase subunit b